MMISLAEAYPYGAMFMLVHALYKLCMVCRLLACMTIGEDRLMATLPVASSMVQLHARRSSRTQQLILQRRLHPEDKRGNR